MLTVTSGGRMNKLFLITGALMALSNCSNINEPPGSGAPELSPVQSAIVVDEKTYTDVPASVLIAQAGSDEGFSRSNDEFQIIGESTASLGAPGRPGLWIDAPYISGPMIVEIYSVNTGLSVLAQADKTDGFSQMSLSAFQALQLSPATLPSIQVRSK